MICVADSTAFVYDGYGRRTSKGSLTYTYDSEGKLVKSSDGLEFVYDSQGLSGFKYNNTNYIYRKNVQGDIISILAIDGAEIVCYNYNAWGECSSTGDADLAQLNPIRYRSYYFDSETGLYFLKTRYYDPAVGRFISQDDISYIDPETIGGCNLYAYCGNNPVMGYDPDGTFDQGIFVIAKAFEKVGNFFKAVGRFIAGVAITVVGAALTIATIIGTVATFIPSLLMPSLFGSNGISSQFSFSTMMYGYFMMVSAFSSVSGYANDIYNDMSEIGWNPFNSDVGKTLNGKRVSFYKGAPVFFTNNKDGSATYLGIFLSKNMKTEEYLRHEWGHIGQQLFLGLAKYSVGIAIPSLIGAIGNKNGKDYDSQPWERSAELFGGIKGKTYNNNSLLWSILYYLALYAM